MRGSILVAAAACMWGMWSLSTRSAELHSTVPLPGSVETFIIFAVIGVVTLPFALRARGGVQARAARHWLLLALLGAADALNCMCFFSAMQKTTIAVAVLTHYLQPLLVAVAAPLLLRERWQSKTGVALVVALAGLLLLLQPWAGTEIAAGGAGLGALSAVFFAMVVLLSKALAPRFSIPELACYPKAASVVVLAIALPSTGAAIEAAPLLWIAGGAVLFGTFPLFLFYRGLATTSAGAAAVLTLCEPLVAVLVGAVVWGQIPGPLALLGGGLVLGGAAIITWTPRPPDP